MSPELLKNGYGATSNVTDEKFEQIIKTFSDEYASEFLRIKNKDAQIVPFEFNRPQQKIYRIYKQALKTGKPLRFINLKARQEGVSTFWQAVIFHRTTTGFNRKAKTIAHEMEASTNLFEMANLFYDQLPRAMQPKIEHSNEKKLSFSALKSSMKIGSADAGEKLSRSDTIQDLHCTEVAFWRAAKAGLNALIQTVPDNPDTLIVLESTGNGIGGEFFDRWQAAKAGESDFIPIFLAWFEDEEYSMEFDSPADKKEFEKSLSDEESDLRKIYKVSLEQLNWRRWAIKNKCGGDVRLFRQEYPSNDVEAFIASGRPVFDIEQCDRSLKLAEGPERIGNLIYTSDKKDAVRFIDNANGFIKLLDEPKVLTTRDYAFRYAAGCDVAEGLEQGDYNSIRILDRKRMRVCLDYHGHVHPDLLAEEQHKISLFLDNDVWFCTERNNHGLTTIVLADRLKVKQYYDSKFDKGYEVTTDKIGFKTSAASKPRLIEALIAAVRDELYIDDDKDAWGEMMTFVHNARGQMQAQDKDRDPGTKCFDDRVIATGLMWRCHQWMPQIKSIKPVPKKKQWFEELVEANQPKTKKKSWRDVTI